MIRHTRRLLWRLLALFALALGFIGLFLPVMPTVPFVLLAAWAAGRGWPQLEAWMLDHPRYGPPIRHWREQGAVPRKAKWLACTMMAGSALLLWFLPIPTWLRGGVYAVMFAVALWLCLRPEPTRAATPDARLALPSGSDHQGRDG